VTNYFTGKRILGIIFLYKYIFICKRWFSDEHFGFFIEG